MFKRILFLIVFSFSFSQNHFFGIELETHGNIVNPSFSNIDYTAQLSLEYSLFYMADILYDLQYRVRFSVGEKVAKEDISNGYYEWRFYYYSITPELKYSIYDNYYAIAGYSMSFLNKGTLTITSKEEDISVPIDIKPSNFSEGNEQSVTNTVHRVLFGIGADYHIKGLIFMPKIIYYHGFNNALKKNDTYDFTFSSFSFNVGLSF